jgi:hypothetical protein
MKHNQVLFFVPMGLASHSTPPTQTIKRTLLGLQKATNHFLRMNPPKESKHDNSN